MKHSLTEYTRYNYWANNRMANRFSQVADTILEQEVPSSFPSMAKTIMHIWDSEQIWLSRLRGHSLRGFPSEVFEGELTDIIGGWTKTSAEFVAFVEDQPEAFFVTECNYQTTSGKPQQQLHGEMIHHCMNHSTYHRGQLTTLAHQLEIDELPNTDYITYLRERK